MEEDEEAPPGVPPAAPATPPPPEDDDTPAAAAVAAAAAAALWATEAEEPGMVRVLWGSVELLELADVILLPPPPVAPEEAPEEVRLDRPEWPMLRACCFAESIVTWRPWVWYALWARPRIEASRGGTTGHGS